MFNQTLHHTHTFLHFFLFRRGNRRADIRAQQTKAGESEVGSGAQTFRKEGL